MPRKLDTVPGAIRARHTGAVFAPCEATCLASDTERPASPSIALTITTPLGPAHGRWRPSSQRHAAVILLPGADNVLSGPAGLYDALGPALQRAGAVAQLEYSTADSFIARRDLILSVLDSFGRQGIERVVVIGWDLGGALAIATGARSPLVTGVACLAPTIERCQSTQINEDIAAINPRRLFIAHGSADRVAPQSASILLGANAGEQAELALYRGESHEFTRYRKALAQRLTAWATGVLSSPFRPRGARVSGPVPAVASHR
ncbi:MAG TPA: dienelactone hydrolase family protein [Ktedonobacterales bacterium]